MVDDPAVFPARPGDPGGIVIEAERDLEDADPPLYAAMGVANRERFLAEAGLR